MNNQFDKSQISRRDVLKLAALGSLFTMELPGLFIEATRFEPGASLANILVLVFDTLSAKNMSLYGYDRATTPNLARFAERSTVYHANYAAGNFTSPATASIFSGAYPWSHRAFNLHGTITSNFAQNNIFNLLPDHYHKVAYTHNLLVTSFLSQFQAYIDVFKQTRELCLADEQYSDRIFPADYNISFWSEGVILRGSGSKPSSLFLAMLYKLMRLGAKQNLTKEYGHLFPRGIPNLNDIYFVLEDVMDWIMQQVALLPQPYFSYVHVLPPHEPYTTRREFVDIFMDDYTPIQKPEHIFSEKHSNRHLNQQRREYDEYIAYTDAEFGRLYDFLEQSGTLDNTYVVVTSDHGELFERGIRGHVTQAMFEPLLHVPLLIHSPGQKHREDIYTPTSGVDLLPTFLQLTGQEIPEWCEGRPLPGIGGVKSEGERNIYAMEAKGNPKHAPVTKGTLVLIKENYKYIYYLGSKNQERENELYDIKADPEEMENLYRSQRSISAELQHEVENKLQNVNQVYQRS